ncbi:MAG: hypothetical protein K8U57_40165 [Planctomycetes bacterium]|nr:hypothetical protein [Planctomycetota bacterium]
MIDAATAEKPTKMANPSPATRMWVVLQKLTRARDDYTRAKDRSTRLALAGNISDFVTQLQSLADTLPEKAER